MDLQMDCVDPGTWQLLLGQQLPEAREEELWTHVESCDACRAVLAALSESPPERFAPDAVAKWMGRYEVGGVVGSGAFGRVYSAFDPQLNRRIALKVRKRSDDSPAANAQLVREAQAMAQLSHPNVVSVFDAGVWKERVFIAMELVEGGDLSQWLAAAPRRVAEILDAFCAAGRGLAAAHALGMVHRDFKPQNVLVGADGRCRVTDFGLALEPLKKGQISGTLAYMSPEQLRGDRLDPRSDQFAFCTALFEALFGTRPFPTDGEPRLEAIQNGRLAFPDASRVHPKLRAIVARGLSARQADRWPNMDALLEALQRDRTRVLRAVAQAAAALLLVVAFGGAADLALRARMYAAARESFSATRQRVERTLSLRYETFSALADLSALLPIIRQVAATRDESDFGLGQEAGDRERFGALHASLRDADWRPWRAAIARGSLAVADSKGRLCYSTEHPEAWGGDLKGLRAVASALDPLQPAASTQVLRADDPLLARTGLSGSGQQAGLVLLLARGLELAGTRPAVFIQIIRGRRLLEELPSEPQTRVALVSSAGAIEGDVPPELALRAGDEAGGLEEKILPTGSWWVERLPLPAMTPGATPDAEVVLARTAGSWLSERLPGVRKVLAGAGMALLALLAWAIWRIRAQARQVGPRQLRRPKRSTATTVGMMLALSMASSAHAARTRFAWLNDTDTLPERTVEWMTWIWEEDGSPGIPAQTNVLWTPVVGVTDRLELLIPIQLEFDQLQTGLNTTFDHFGLELRYQLTSPDPVERGGPFSFQVRGAVGRLVNQRDRVQFEGGLVTAFDQSRVHVVLDLPARVQVGGPNPATVDLLPGLGVSVLIVDELRLGVEATSQLEFSGGSFTPWVAVGPDIAWTHGRFWLSGGFLVGVTGIGSVPRVNFGITF